MKYIKLAGWWQVSPYLAGFHESLVTRVKMEVCKAIITGMPKPIKFNPVRYRICSPFPDEKHLPRRWN